MKPKAVFPVLEWAPAYTRAAVVVTIMLVPQSLAYAMLAGLPPSVGLYASILPLIAYAVFGTSRTLAVGPVAVVSLVTAAAIGKVAAPGSDAYLVAEATLALLSGLVLLAMAVLRLGFLANFLSHPVISGFKGPVMDALKRSDFFDHFTGSIFLAQHEAAHALAGRSCTA